MFSFSQMRFTVPFGFYPQKLDTKHVSLTRIVRSWVQSLRRIKFRSTNGATKFVKAVDDYEREINDLSTQQIKYKIQELRYTARKHGMNEDYAAHVFAIVRECSQRHLGMRHYPYQLIGARAMLHGYIIEMETGQGKSLCATLAACASALAGVRVHIITVNEYLACRDAEKFESLYNALGLTVTSITEDMSEENKQAAYQSDVVYCTNKQVTFDYLRDRIALGNEVGKSRLQLESLFGDAVRSEKLILPGLCFAIVDEADSVLIDEAITPLIISAAKSQSNKQPVYEKALWLSHQLEPDVDFIIDVARHVAELTDAGKRRLDAHGQKLGGLWKNSCPKEELVIQAIRARFLYIKDQHYLVDEDKIKIIDELTGRVMADRSWSEGLHQMVEMKEQCPLTDARITLAKISYQRFFRRYVNMAGLTGTAREVKKELKTTYGMDVYCVPRSEPSKRTYLPTQMFATQSEKWNAVVLRIEALHQQRVPVLIGTRSVKSSMLLSQMLIQKNIPHQLLNARQDKCEAEIVAKAGGLGQITVATNMAGRGTDIGLAAESVELGGLYVINTERHETRRVDRQLYGRCGRQSDPGIVESMISLEDELIQQGCPKIILRFCHLCLAVGGFWLGKLPLSVFYFCQLVMERKQRRARKHLIKVDEQHEKLLAFSGLME
jgi:preprotein translocase subunit SecA